MTTEHDPPDVDADLARYLGDPALWDSPDPSVEDAVVTAIADEAARATAPPASAAPSSPAAASGRTTVRWLRPVAAIAAACLLFVAGYVVADRSGGENREGTEVALAGTDAAPTAEAAAVVLATPNGTRIDLQVVELAPAPEGSVYQAWLTNGEERVSAGTFHLRGGPGELELWAGVDIADFPTLTVTLDEVGADSSGPVVLRSG